MLSVYPMNLAAASSAQVEELVRSMGEPAFRAKQLLHWIWKEGVFDLDHMTNLSLSFRAKLKESCTITVPRILTANKSEDGTIKYLLELSDGKSVETVWIPREDQNRVTLCISTQVGCRMGCTFCLTAQQKVERNLSAGEIAGQILVMPNRERITNVVVMGMGEPFDNYDNLMAALDIITNPERLEIGPRRVTVSTSGLVPMIKKFLVESKCRLAVSLNAPNDEIRSQIMPINRAYPLDTLLGTLKEMAHPRVQKPVSRRFSITFEYILIAGLNDQPEHAAEVSKRLRGIPAKINVLLYNENPHIPFKRPDDAAVSAFRAVLSKNGYLNFIRSSRGRDISAACGQLASNYQRSQVAHVAASI
jgi:23S rRNA (adenine2503-C2)-methyltransferase